MKLRIWQSECVEKALEKYQIDSHFFCLATPGAGKTVMAAEVARRLVADNLIDFIICFSPSSAVVQGIKETFQQVLNANFDGLIGSIGASYTYQSMPFLSQDFWSLLEDHKVLVVLDEIHHCAGSNLSNCNSWGEKILANIDGKADYTLAMSGTPWRTDSAPLVLANYRDINSLVKCDYEYGLTEAVKDGVCRSPNIVLIDNDECSIIDANEGQIIFSGIEELLKNKYVNYRSLINDTNSIDYMLNTANERLLEVRLDLPDAAGLVVASSISHAQFICERIKESFGVDAILVNYLTPQSQEIINQFKNSKDLWIVSIGMISEGTDIPRLQVCCHLSQIKTEMYYRQILGRILRKTTKNNEFAWLYTFAEKNLVLYANRVALDIPDYPIITNMKADKGISNIELDIQCDQLINERLTIKDHGFSKSKIPLITWNDKYNIEETNIFLSEKYKESVISVFDSPF